MYIDDIYKFGKNEKKNTHPYTSSLNLQPGYRNEIWDWKMHNAYDKKKQLPSQESMRTLGKEDSDKYPAILEAASIKKREMKEKVIKNF